MIFTFIKNLTYRLNWEVLIFKISSEKRVNWKPTSKQIFIEFSNYLENFPKIWQISELISSAWIEISMDSWILFSLFLNAYSQSLPVFFLSRLNGFKMLFASQSENTNLFNNFGAIIPRPPNRCFWLMRQKNLLLTVFPNGKLQYVTLK